MRVPLIGLVLVGGIASCLPGAVEPQISDLRLIVESRPTGCDFTWHDQRQEGGGDDAFATAVAAGPGVRWGFGAAGQPLQALAGADILGVVREQDALVCRGVVVRGEGGIAYGIATRWTASLTADVGLSRNSAQLVTGTSPDMSFSGTGWETGVKGGIRYGLDRSWSLGVEIGWIASQDHLHGDEADLDLRQSGVIAGLALAWTLDPSPRPLGGR